MRPFAFVLVALLGLAASAHAIAQEVRTRTVPVESVVELRRDASDTGEPLRVGVVERAPYAVETEAGWVGIAVDGWRLVAERAGLAFELVPIDGGTAIEAVATGRVDLVLPIDATAERAERVVFTAPLHTATLGVAGGRGAGPLAVIGRLVTWEFVRIVLGLSALLLLVGAIVWMLERRRNSDMFHEDARHGLGDGFWWAGVTLTTIGYGDKAPVTFGGRAVAMVWMLAGLAISSALTAAIVSATGFGERATSLPEGLRGLDVVVEEGTAAARFLSASGIAHSEVEDADAALRAVHRGEVDAFVAAAPLLAERVKALDLDVPVKRSEREPHLVSIARSPDAEWGARVDRAVIATVTAPAWGDLLARYLER